MDIQELYQELIIDHGTTPRNHYILNYYDHDAKGHNPLCGDKIHVFLHVQDDQIQNISFEGVGCAISMASASIMTEMLKHKTVKEAMALFEAFSALVTEQQPSTSAISLGKLKALAGVKAYPSRVKCATLAWHTLKAALEDGNIISTE